MCEGDKALYDLYTSNAAVGRVLTKLYRTPGHDWRNLPKNKLNFLFGKTFISSPQSKHRFTVNTLHSAFELEKASHSG